LSYFDCSKAREELGWEPDIDLETGLRLTVQYYRSKPRYQQSRLAAR
jgi:nucleoside-diphosphate-sugar epimerase